MNLSIKKTSIVALLFLTYELHSQDLTDNMKNWTDVSISYKINKDFKVKAKQLFTFNMSPYKYSFSQTKIGLAYKIKRRAYIEAGYVIGLFNESNSLIRQGAIPAIFNTLAVSRIYGRYSYKHDLVKRVSLKHKIEFQYFFTDLDKYKTRSIYATRLGYNVRKSSLSPYIESQFYFYQGGTKISNGIKRFRLKTGLSFKPVKGSSTRLSLYYFLQNEFNTEQLSDNDYTVLGASVSFRIK